MCALAGIILTLILILGLLWTVLSIGSGIAAKREHEQERKDFLDGNNS